MKYLVKVIEIKENEQEIYYRGKGSVYGKNVSDFIDNEDKRGWNSVYHAKSYIIKKAQQEERRKKFDKRMSVKLGKPMPTYNLHYAYEIVTY